MDHQRHAVSPLIHCACAWTPRDISGLMGPDLGYRQVVPTFRAGSSWANPGPSAPQEGPAPDPLLPVRGVPYTLHGP